MHDAPWMNDEHCPCATCWRHCCTAFCGHCSQLVVSQSSMQPVSWLQLLETNGLTQLKMPVPSVKANWNGDKHFAHAALICGSVWKKSWHEAELKPSAHAAFASCRSVELHWFFVTVSVGVVTVDGQLEYVAGHVVCCDLQTRGVASVSHVDWLCVQSAQLAPCDPQRVSRKPAKHVPVWQQPTHVCELHVDWHVPALHVSFFCVQSVQARPPRPHCVSVSLVTHVLPEQQPLQFCGVQSGGVLVH